jgi:hypothetical protein
MEASSQYAQILQGTPQYCLLHNSEDQADISCICCLREAAETAGLVNAAIATEANKLTEGIRSTALGLLA